ncbi:MAG TPA: rRNA maturation RNase YbeY [Candidatus Acidoferrales bacterium]|nr:rRNA maturation RNase YbeY [Candidatus Acidoferrales bacterium]
MVINQQKRVRVKVRALDEFLHRAAALVRLPADSATISLVTDAQIAKWNRAYRGKDRPTDVLSFPTADDGRNGSEARVRSGETVRAAREEYLGDIAIAPAVARRTAREDGHSLDKELQILALHGLLHLMGYDHETDDGTMERIEMRLRKKLRIAP